MTNFTEENDPEQRVPRYLLNVFLTLAVVNIALSVTACIGNTLILMALCRESFLHPPSKLLYRYLAFTDLCVGLIAQPLFVGLLFKLFKEREKPWDHTSIFGLAFFVTGVLLSGISLATLTVISIDRLLALLLMLRYKHVVTVRRVWVVVIFLWFPHAAAGMVGVWYPFLFFCLSFLGITIELLCSGICYTKIAISLRQRQVQVQGRRQRMQQSRRLPMNIARYKRSVFSAMFVHFSLVACFTPYIIISVLGLNEHRSPTFYAANAISVTVVFFNSSLNPALYCWRIREVRQAVKQIILQLSCS